MPLVSLDDLGKYAVWIIDNPKRSAALELGVAIAHVTGAEQAAAFERVTGKKCVYNDIPLEEFLATTLPPGKIGAGASPGYDDPTNLSAAGHFGPWYTIWKDSDNSGTTGCWARDYKLLDEIMPDRIKTLEEWMRKVRYEGVAKPVLKTGLSL